LSTSNPADPVVTANPVNPHRAGSRWYVVRTNPRCEERARRSLQRSGFGVYVPMRKIERQHRRSKTWSTSSHRLFTGYLFVDMGGRGSKLVHPAPMRRRGGCSGRHGWPWRPVPFPVPGRLVERLMAMQLNMAFDDTREAAKRRGETVPNLYPAGSKIMAIKGALAGYSGSLEVTGVTASGIIEALAMLFGRLTPVRLPADQVERWAA